MATRKKIEINENYEFELDLAPLLAVMVKLVPVLLVSSAFVQLMVIETELPQAVQQQMQEATPQDKQIQVMMTISNQNGIKINVTGEQINEVMEIKNSSASKFDYTQINEALIKVKTKYPAVFKIAIYPEKDVNYKEIIKIMDQARKSKNPAIRFPVFDKTQNKKVMTDYMFPDVEFGNILEG